MPYHTMPYYTILCRRGSKLKFSRKGVVMRASEPDLRPGGVAGRISNRVSSGKQWGSRGCGFEHRSSEEASGQPFRVSLVLSTQLSSQYGLEVRY